MEHAIIAPRCANAGCHEGRNAAAGLSLVPDDQLAARLIGVPSQCNGQPLVDANNPTGNSYLLDKVSLAFPGCGLQMPSAGTLLTSGEQACLRNWLGSLGRIRNDGPAASSDAGAEAGASALIGGDAP